MLRMELKDEFPYAWPLPLYFLLFRAHKAFGHHKRVAEARRRCSMFEKKISKWLFMIESSCLFFHHFLFEKWINTNNTLKILIQCTHTHTHKYTSMTESKKRKISIQHKHALGYYSSCSLDWLFSLSRIFPCG